jgi:hypothetical protein
MRLARRTRDAHSLSAFEMQLHRGVVFWGLHRAFTRSGTGGEDRAPGRTTQAGKLGHDVQWSSHSTCGPTYGGWYGPTIFGCVFFLARMLLTPRDVCHRRLWPTHTQRPSPQTVASSLSSHPLSSGYG